MQTRLKLCSFALIVNTPQSPMQIITANSSYMFDLISSKSTFGLAIANFLTFIHVFTLLNIRFEKKKTKYWNLTDIKIEPRELKVEGDIL